MRTSMLAAFVMAAAFSFPCLAADTHASGMAAVSDATFVKKAAISDMYEIAAAKLAKTKSGNADVKSFADQMETAHTQTTDQLKSIVGSKPDLKLPTDMDAQHKAMMSRLRQASGADFDKAYIAQQVNAHNAAVMLFTSESQNGQDADLKKFAGDTLPTLQQHLTMAENLQKGRQTK